MTPISLELPGGAVPFERLVLDFTGTLSRDGELLPGVAERLRGLASQLRVIVLTADTFGKARRALEGLPVEVQIIRDGSHKANVFSELGPETAIAMGNGRNDVPMIRMARVGIAVIGPEGAAGELIAIADVVTTNIQDALDLVSNPLRLKATLRD